MKLGTFKVLDATLFIVICALWGALVLLESELRLIASIGLVGVSIHNFIFYRKRKLKEKNPLETLIFKEGDELVFKPLHNFERTPLRVGIHHLYAINVLDGYVGVIINDNGKGYDLSYPFSERELQDHVNKLVAETVSHRVSNNLN